MITVKTDLHTHTLASGHAYSTIEENVRHGAQVGLEVVGVADHFSGVFYPGTDFGFYGNFTNYKALPPEWYGVKILHGAEADIVDKEGHLFGHDIYADLPWMKGITKLPSYEEMILSKLDYVIASVHLSLFLDDATLVEKTEMYCRALENPKVLMLGHVGRAGVDFDVDTVLSVAKSQGKMIEINAASMDYPETVVGKCRSIAERCAELGVSIAVNSDAHSAYYVGKYDKAIQMLNEIHFPEELVGNRDYETLKSFLKGLKA